MIQSSAAEDETAASRPRWHWVLIGAGLAVTLWAPLVAIATPLGVLLARHLLALPVEAISGGAALTPRQASAIAACVAIPLLLAFGISSFGAGALVGRFGGRAGPAQAALGTALGGALVASLAFLAFPAKSGISWTSAAAGGAALAVVGGCGGFLGGTFGFRKRPC